jgi:hypothetical protein
MRIRSWARRYSDLNPVRVEGDPVLSGLNATQTRAIAMMVGERISLVQGVSAMFDLRPSGTDILSLKASWYWEDKDHY